MVTWSPGLERPHAVQGPGGRKSPELSVMTWDAYSASRGTFQITDIDDGAVPEEPEPAVMEDHEPQRHYPSKTRVTGWWPSCSP
jgi:hypothetical protein